jgi:Flp pilus assembly protein TadG
MQISSLGRKRARLIRFGREHSGSITVEFVIWIPVFLVIMGFIADATSLYLMQADMWNVARDTARRMTTGQLSAPAAQTYAASALLYPNRPYTVTATQGTDDVVEISIPVQNASIFGVLAAFGGFSNSILDAKVTMRDETALNSNS